MLELPTTCGRPNEMCQFSGADVDAVSSKSVNKFKVSRFGRKIQTDRCKSEEKTGLLGSGFEPKTVGRNMLHGWLALQIVGLVFQLRLWAVVRQHLREYDEMATRECLPTDARLNACKSTMWNVSYRQAPILRGEESVTFEFESKSQPPTFLLNVDPYLEVSAAPGWLPSYLLDIEWTLTLQRLGTPQFVLYNDVFREGPFAFTVQDLSEAGFQRQRIQGRVRWQAILKNRGVRTQTVRFSVFIEDAVTLHLSEIQANPSCNVGSAWKAFNQQKHGYSHRALAWCSFAWSTSFLLGIAAIGIVVYESGPRAMPSGFQDFAGKHRFHIVVLAKFLLHDMPQQIGFVLYFLGWFEAEGLKCQLCLFDRNFCAEEHPLNYSHVIALGCLFLSSLSNQMLVRPADVKIYSELDACWNGMVRLCLGGVTTLPFTTGIFMASSSLLSMPALFHTVVAIPCYLGWCVIAGVLCFPFVGCYVKIIEICEGSA